MHLLSQSRASVADPEAVVDLASISDCTMAWKCAYFTGSLSSFFCSF